MVTTLAAMKTTAMMTARPRLSTIRPGLTCMPMLMKNTAMNSSLTGSTFCISLWPNLDMAIIIPMRNAPMATSSPIEAETAAMAKHRPTATMRTISGEYLFPIQLMSRGTKVMPNTTDMPMNRISPTIMVAVEPSAGVSPASKGAAMVSMSTWPTSSKIVIVTISLAMSASMCLAVLRTPTTTAVLVPDMMAPRKIDCTKSMPSRMPRM